MKTKYVYWQDDNMWLGYLEEYPDYWTQGETEEELKENLLDIYQELTGGIIPNIRKVAELEVSWNEGIWLSNLRQWAVFLFVMVVNTIGIKIL